jgi:hypothetical protein
LKDTKNSLIFLFWCKPGAKFFDFGAKFWILVQNFWILVQNFWILVLLTFFDIFKSDIFNYHNGSDIFTILKK